jgi:hypothetical protein
MGVGFRGCFFAWLLAANLTPGWGQEAPLSYRFSTPNYSIDVEVSYQEPYEGRAPIVYRSTEPQKPVCLVAASGASGCADSFVGAIAIVTFVVKRTPDGKPAKAWIGERVAVIEQSEGLPERPPFTMRVRLVGGVGSDVQAFGYDEGQVPESMRAGEREAVKTLWRRFRQELFMNKDEKPFAIFEWLHTIGGIRLVRADGQPDSLSAGRLSR